MVVDCTLRSQDVDNYLNDETRTWTLNDAALAALGNDVQAVVNCTQEGDTILFDASESIQPSGRIALPWRLILSAVTDDEPVDGIFAETVNKTTFRCPSETEGVFLISSSGALLANLAFDRCTLEGEDGGAAIVEVETCDEEGTGSLQMHHVRYFENQLDFAQTLLVNAPSCSAVEMVDVLFDRNVCDGGFCGAELSTNNILTRIILRENDFSEASKLLSGAILYVPADATTVIENMTATENDATSLRIEDGELTIVGSEFLNNTAEADAENASSACLHLINVTAEMHQCRFEGNRAQSGSAVWAEGSNLTVTSVEFVGNEASDGGAGMLIINGTLLDVSDCTFDENTADGQGGGIRAVNTAIVVKGTSFTNNTASRGAGIDIEGNRLEIQSCNFEGNAASIEAGGIRFVGDDCNLNSVVLVGNLAEDAGGAAVIENGTSASLSNFTCEGNAAHLGGCLHIQGTPLLLEDAVFRGNNATVGGGGLSIRNTTEANISSSVFEGNSEAEDGGALYLFGNNFTRIAETQFRNNNATRFGAGIYVEEVGEVVLDDSAFEENSSGDRGGGIYCTKKSELKIVRTEFLDNRSNGAGCGVLVTRGCNGSFTNSTWVRNNAGSWPGGGLMIDGVDGVIENSIFEENRASTGAGVYINEGMVSILQTKYHNNTSSSYGALAGEEANVTASDCIFSDNQARNGAAIGLTAGSNCTFSRAGVFNNTADSGGCLLSLASTVAFLNSDFENNTARDSGGCFFGNEGELVLDLVSVRGSRVRSTGGALWASSSTISISNTLISNNEALAVGGGMRLRSSRLSMSNVTIERCKAGSSGGGLALSSGGTASVENTKLVQNEANENGGGIYVGYSVSLEGIGVRFLDNEAAIFGGGMFVEENCNVSLRHSRFASNRAREGGGAGFRIETVATVQESEFVNNTAVLDGGDSYTSENSTLNLINCSAQDSRAETGGSIYGSYSTLSIVGTEFHDELAKVKGGAVAATNGSVITVDGMFVSGSSAKMGGAVHFEATSFIGRSLRVSKNRAQDGGGVMAEISSTMLCADCVFEENTADEAGGGVALDANDTQALAFQFDNCNFTRNAAMFGGGIHFVTPSSRVDCTDLTGNCTYLALRGTAFTGNEASVSGGAILASNLDTIRISCVSAKASGQDALPFLSLEELKKLNILNSMNAVCLSWKENMAEEFGYILASYGRGMNVTLRYEGTRRDEPVTGNSIVIPDHSSGSPLPTFLLRVVDALGQGPVKGRGDRSIVATMSSATLFAGDVIVDMQNGTGIFSGISGYAAPGNSEVIIEYNEPSILPLIITVEIRKCKIGESSVQDGTLCQRCPGGTYNLFPDRKNQSCVPCPDDANCDKDFPRPKAGYWHRTPCSPYVKKCLSRRACVALDRQAKLEIATVKLTDCNLTKEELAKYSAAQCKEGYTGVLCGSCSDSHGRMQSFRCERCLGKISSSILIALSMSLLVIFTAFTIRGGLPSHRKSSVSRTSRRSMRWRESVDGPPFNIEMVRMHITGHVPREIIEGRPTQETVEREANKHRRDLAKWKATEIFKITINFLQVTAVAIAVNVDWTDGLIGMFEIADILGVATSGAATRSADCLVSVDATIPRSAVLSILTVLNPVFVASFFVVIWILRTVISSASTGYLAKRCTLSLLAVSYLSYIAITRTSVNSLYCIDVHDSTDVSSDDVHAYWAVDTRLRCHEGSHAVLEATIGWPLLVVFSLGFPLVMAIVLVFYRSRYGMESEWLFESAGFLYRAYQNAYVYWESIIMLRKAALAVIVVFSYPLGANLQGVLCVCVLIVALYIHTTCSPFRDEFSALNYFEGMSLLLSSLTFAAALFFNDNVTSEPIRIFVTVLLIVGNVSLLVVFLFLALRYGLEYIRLFVLTEEVPHNTAATNFQIVKVYIVSRFQELFGRVVHKTDERHPASRSASQLEI